MSAVHSLLPAGVFYLATAVPQIPFVHNIQKRRKLIAALHCAVHAIFYGYKANALFSEHNLSIEAHLQIIPANSAHILGDYAADFARFNIRN